MAPSVDDFQGQINRDLQQGDVLVKRHSLDGGYTTITKHYEVLKPHIIGKRKILFGLLGTREKDCVEVAELTQYGRLNKTHLFSRESDFWYDIIRSENRIGNPSTRER